MVTAGAAKTTFPRRSVGTIKSCIARYCPDSISTRKDRLCRCGLARAEFWYHEQNKVSAYAPRGGGVGGEGDVPSTDRRKLPG